MEKELSVYYDEEGDLLEIRIGKPMNGYFNDLGDDIFERVDEDGEIKGFTIMNFKKRAEKLKPIEVSLPVKIKFASS